MLHAMHFNLFMSCIKFEFRIRIHDHAHVHVHRMDWSWLLCNWLLRRDSKTVQPSLDCWRRTKRCTLLQIISRGIVLTLFNSKKSLIIYKLLWFDLELHLVNKHCITFMHMPYNWLYMIAYPWPRYRSWSAPREPHKVYIRLRMQLVSKLQIKRLQ